jgi:hypothetical protein
LSVFFIRLFFNDARNGIIYGDPFGEQQ